jgi:cell division transport system permease protein
MASLSNWVMRHGQAFVSSAGHLARHRFATLLTVAVMGLALALPLSLQVLVRNLRGATGDFSGAIGLSVYLKPQVSEQQARQLARTAAARPGVGHVTLITAAQALEEFRTQSGFGDALGALTDNPLPHVLSIQPTAAAEGPQQLDALRAWLSAWPEVDSVELDRDWVLRFNAILGLLRRVVAITAALLAVGVVAVVGNTIRLEILNRRAEIEVTKLVGATNAFVRRPFLYTGMFYGAGAGLLAWGIVAIARALLAPAATRLAAAYGQRFELLGPTPRELGLLAAAGVVLGGLGALVATTRELARIEP